MKILTRIAVVVAIAILPFMVGDRAFAAGTCEMGYTGPNSNNECVLESTYTCSVKNENDFDIVNENGQVVGSGSAASTDNTDAGGTTSGSATNSNGTSINVSITNGDEGKLCTVVTTMPPTPEPPAPHVPKEVPSSGQGAASPIVKEAVTAPQQVTPALLPNTSGDNAAGFLLTATGLLAAGAVVTRLAVAAYSRSKS